MIIAIVNNIISIIKSSYYQCQFCMNQRKGDKLADLLFEALPIDIRSDPEKTECIYHSYCFVHFLSTNYSFLSHQIEELCCK